ncbi:hypothetical protein Tco_0857859 [Tanacetum coccineum]|uniref:Uncharacterized protein n=1 Tax=Tanacetum coccineum TaxID=301880 RepID=A0ABQ5B9N9_9ASTR
MQLRWMASVTKRVELSQAEPAWVRSVKGVVRWSDFWCQACEKAVDYPVLRYRLELDTTTSASKLTM